MSERFLNRVEELGALERWWAQPGASIAMVWGRRRVGKTALLQEFSRSRPVVFHTGGGRTAAGELLILSELAADWAWPARDLRGRPFRDWDDVFDTLLAAAGEEPRLLVLDEFPELVRMSPELPGALRAAWDRGRSTSRLRVILTGSAVRTMRELQEHRAPLYGRSDLNLQVNPFRPFEAAMMLPRLRPADRALVWGLVGGVPQYLKWWDQDRSVAANVGDLFCRPGGLLLTEAQFLLANDIGGGDLSGRVLHAIAAGRTRYHEIADEVQAVPARTLERLVELHLVEQVVPVTQDPRKTRRRSYRIADNYLAFWLGQVNRYRSEIERGLGPTIVPTLMRGMDDHMGARWEEAMREHLRRLAINGELDDDVVAIGPYWRDGGDEIDAVVLAGRNRSASLAAEAKWSRTVDARRVLSALKLKAAALPRKREPLRYAIAAREGVTHAGDALTITAADVFSP